MRLAKTLLLILSALTFGSHTTARAQTRQVFAHYMLANRDEAPDDLSGERDIVAYQHEIRQAQALGIDGFALNAGGWFREPRYIRRAAEMFEAALRLQSGFKLFFSADMCCSNDAGDVEDMVRRFAGNPRYAAVYFRYQGKFLLTTFAGSARGPQWWSQVKSDLAQGTHPSTRRAPCYGQRCTLAAAAGVPSSSPLPVLFVPAFFFGGETPTSDQVQDGLRVYGDVLDGAFYWGIAGVPGQGAPPDQLPSSEAYAAALHKAGKLYMAPVAPQFSGLKAKRNFDYAGLEGMTRLWRSAIESTRPDWVEIITWNDFVEATYISPILRPSFDRPKGWEVEVHSHAGFAALTSLFIRWFKAGGVRPVTEDSLFWAYHTQTFTANAPTRFTEHGPLANLVYVTAALHAAATLTVSSGRHSESIQLAAGLQSVRFHAYPGAPPQFTLRRGNNTIAEGRGLDPIRVGTDIPDLCYSTGFLTHAAAETAQHSARGSADRLTNNASGVDADGRRHTKGNAIP